jgi:hypothetical protein
MSKKRASNYLAFLIRLWRENELAPWRVTAQNATTEERQGFADLRKLVLYLEEQTGATILLPPDHSPTPQPEAPQPEAPQPEAPLSDAEEAEINNPHQSTGGI